MSMKFKYQEDMDIIKNEHNCDCPNKDLKTIEDFVFKHMQKRGEKKINEKRKRRK